MADQETDAQRQSRLLKATVKRVSANPTAYGVLRVKQVAERAACAFIEARLDPLIEEARADCEVLATEIFRIFEALRAVGLAFPVNAEIGEAMGRAYPAKDFPPDVVQDEIRAAIEEHASAYKHESYDSEY